MEMTLRWAERSKKYFEEHKQEVPWGDQQPAIGCQQKQIPGSVRNDNALQGRTQALFGIVQGGMDPALRKESAERTIEIGFPGYAIGGLSVGEPRHLTREVVESTFEYLPADKPRYLMGVGTPEEIVEYANLGIDMMDCVSHPRGPSRTAVYFAREDLH